jgi:hypothetical protein
MTQVTIIPAEGQVSDLLDSPMTDSEKSFKLQIEARSKAAAADKFEQQRIMADCLLTIYQDRLFRGDQGGRTWGDYLEKEIELLGYGKLTTESAANELNWCVLCNAIDDWNEANPSKQIGFPQSRSYMEGWTTLFDRRASKGGGNSYMPFSDQPAEAALKTWKTACFKLGDKGSIPNRRETNSIGRAARDQGLGREISRLTASTMTRPQPGRGREFDEPVEVRDRTIDPEVLRQAEAAKAAREAAKADPRDFQPLDKHDPIPMNEAETYCNLIGRAGMEVQSMRQWVKGRLNLYGTDGLNHLRNNIDLGIYSVSDDIERITQIRNQLEEVLDLLTDHFEPGDLTPENFIAEPTA